MRYFTGNDMTALARIGGTLLPSEDVFAAVMGAGEAERVDIPEGARYVVFGASGNFIAAFGGPSVEAGGPDASGPISGEMNPAARRIPQEATHISVASAEGAIVTLSFYGA